MNSRGDNNRSLKEWLQVFVQSPQLRDKLYQKKVEKIWAEMMGPAIKGYTRRIRLEQRTLILNIDSASLKSELSIMKESIRTRLNEKLGENFIQEVKFFSGAERNYKTISITSSAFKFPRSRSLLVSEIKICPKSSAFNISINLASR